MSSKKTNFSPCKKQLFHPQYPIRYNDSHPIIDKLPRLLQTIKTPSLATWIFLAETARFTLRA